VEGHEEVTMDGKTPSKRPLGHPREAQQAGPERVAAGVCDQAETLRRRLIAATIEVIAAGSDPRLSESRYSP